jgi:hypothetical protein
LDYFVTRARVDANQPQVVAAFRRMGATVLHLHALGKGAPDILVGHRGKNALVEIKDGAKPPSSQKLTKDEVIFHAEWRGQVAIINSVDEAIAFITQWSD